MTEKEEEEEEKKIKCVNPHLHPTTCVPHVKTGGGHYRINRKESYLQAVKFGSVYGKRTTVKKN